MTSETLKIVGIQNGALNLVIGICLYVLVVMAFTFLGGTISEQWKWEHGGLKAWVWKLCQRSEFWSAALYAIPPMAMYFFLWGLPRGWWWFLFLFGPILCFIIALYAIDHSVNVSKAHDARQKFLEEKGRREREAPLEEFVNELFLNAKALDALDGNCNGQWYRLFDDWQHSASVNSRLLDAPRVIMRRGGNQATELLLPGLHSPELAVRCAAISMLGLIIDSDTKAGPALVNVLREQDSESGFWPGREGWHVQLLLVRRYAHAVDHGDQRCVRYIAGMLKNVVNDLKAPEPARKAANWILESVRSSRRRA